MSVACGSAVCWGAWWEGPGGRSGTPMRSMCSLRYWESSCRRMAVPGQWCRVCSWVVILVQKGQGIPLFSFLRSFIVVVATRASSWLFCRSYSVRMSPCQWPSACLVAVASSCGPIRALTRSATSAERTAVASRSAVTPNFVFRRYCAVVASDICLDNFLIGSFMLIFRKLA